MNMNSMTASIDLKAFDQRVRGFVHPGVKQFVADEPGKKMIDWLGRLEKRQLLASAFVGLACISTNANAANTSPSDTVFFQMASCEEIDVTWFDADLAFWSEEEGDDFEALYAQVSSVAERAAIALQAEPVDASNARQWAHNLIASQRG